MHPHKSRFKLVGGFNSLRATENVSARNIHFTVKCQRDRLTGFGAFEKSIQGDNTFHSRGFTTGGHANSVALLDMALGNRARKSTKLCVWAHDKLHWKTKSR